MVSNIADPRWPSRPSWPGVPDAGLPPGPVVDSRDPGGPLGADLAQT
ncbi:hypothetical protein [Microtetraspora malaysiensis]